MKSALITHKKNLSAGVLADFKRKLFYDKCFVLTQNCKIDKKELKEFKKFIVIECLRKNMPAKINEIIKKNKKRFVLLPYLNGDSNSKYAVKVYNTYFGTKINPSIFKDKGKMNRFLGDDVTKKRNIKLSYQQLKKETYLTLTKIVGRNFILKPVNQYGSLLTFGINSEKQLQVAKKKLKKKYNYIVEEYVDGNLRSIDFFCDGKDIFLLCLSREISFLELIKKLSPKYIHKYKNHVTKDFLHFIPIRYTLGLNKLSQLELGFIKDIGKKLIDKKFRGLIHLEYKVDKKKNKIGFIEWGARFGWKRKDFIDGMYNLKAENIPYEIIYKKDFSRFEKKKGVFFIKNRNIDRNFVGIRTSVLKKTHIIDVLKKTSKFLNISFERFLKDYLWDNWKIRIKDINFVVRTTSQHFLYPFYEKNDTRFDYMIEMDEVSFKKFRQKKHKILEHLVFHDYTKGG